MPREEILRLKEQRDDLLRRATSEQPDDADCRGRDLFAWYAAEVDSILDRHQGAAWLRAPHIADLIAGALLHFADTRYLLPAWCVMPNHVHAVVRPMAGHTLDAILHSWKSYTAHAANRAMKRDGEFWQRESYDHWIRDDADLAHCRRYTEENPVKAGLVSRPSDWPWSSAAKSTSR